MRESPLLAGVVAALLVSVAGCASSLQLADRPAGTATVSGSLREDRNGPLPCDRVVPFDEDVPSPSPPLQLPEANPWFGSQPLLPEVFGNVLADHANYYSPHGLGMLALGTGVAAVVANSPLDETIRRNYQEDYRDIRTDEFSEALHTSKILGNGYVMIPAYCGAALVGSWFDETPLGYESSEWGRRCLRTIVVGAPPMLAMQMLTGASRPGETDDGSTWKPFRDNNGVSGHSFMGAVPFLCAAKMADDPLWKAAFYAGSTLAGLSRINDDRHYTSQVLLGWWMAYLAGTAVDQTQWGNLAVYPWPTADGMGVEVEYCW